MMLYQPMTDKEDRLVPRSDLAADEARRHLASTIALRDKYLALAENLTRHIEEMQSMLSNDLPYANMPPSDAAVDFLSKNKGKHHKDKVRNALIEMGCALKSSGKQRLQAVALGIKHAINDGRIKRQGDLIWIP
jgi:CHASE3 domain sensor protein